MAEFLTTQGTSYNIEKVILDAQKGLYLVSPYLQLSKTFYERLKDASNRGVVIQIVYGKDELKPNERNSLAELKNVELYYFENLHAKCYFNESLMVITSMNMYEFSEKNNREMGVLVSFEKDESLFRKAVSETKSIIENSEQIVLSKTERKISHKAATTTKLTKDAKKSTKESKPGRGYCIRCTNRIPYTIDAPYCKDCYSSWAKYKNYDYEEDFCHGCGEFEETSMEKPVCYKCYKKFEK